MKTPKAKCFHKNENYIILCGLVIKTVYFIIQSVFNIDIDKICTINIFGKTGDVNV